MKTRTTILLLTVALLPAAASAQTRKGSPATEPQSMTLSPVGARAYALPGPSEDPVFLSNLPAEEEFVEAAAGQCLIGQPQASANTRLSFTLRNGTPGYNSSPVTFPTSATFPATSTTCASPNSGCRYMQLAVQSGGAVNDTTTPHYLTAEFQAQVGLASYTGSTVGLGYAFWVGEDRNNNGTYCETGDVCGYLDQTYQAPWLATTRSGDQLQTVRVSHTFRAQSARTVVRVYLYGINASPGAGQVTVNYGTMNMTVARMNVVSNLPNTTCVVVPALGTFSD